MKHKDIKMEEFQEMSAVTYFSKKMVSEDIISVNDLWAEIEKAPKYLKIYLKRVYKTTKQFESFFTNKSHVFFVENEMVALHDPALEDGRINAVEYFKEVMENYDEAPNYMNFRGHIGQASEDVIDFINSFYPGKSFKKFLESQPDVFVVFEDNTVSLIKDKTVDYFEDILNEFGDGQHYLSLRGHIGQAEKHIQEFINIQYPGEDFMKFLLENDDVFNVQGEDVFLM